MLGIIEKKPPSVVNEFVADTYDKKILLTPRQQWKANMALYEALNDDTTDRVEKAIKAGAQVNNTTADGWGRTPLTIAKMFRNTVIADYLEVYGAKEYPEMGRKSMPTIIDGKVIRD
jgi:hypothetical protein